MNRAARGVFVACILAAASSAVLPQENVSGRSDRWSIIDEMVQHVSADTILARIKSLGDFQSRYEYSPQQDSAAAFLTQTMSRWGLVTSEWYSIGLVTVSDIAPVTGSVAWCAAGGYPLRTTNSGASWHLTWGGPYVRALVFVGSDHGWVAGANGFLAATTTGSLNTPSWSNQTSGTSSTFNAVRFLDTKFGIAVGSNRTIRRTTNGGSGWLPTALDTASISLNGISIVDAAHVWVVGGGGAIFFSSDSGGTWTLQVSGTTQPLYGVKFVNPDDGWAVGDGSTVLRTTNGGADWSSVSLPGGVADYTRSIDFADSLHGWIADYRSSTVFRTVDGGIHWEGVLANRGGTIMNLRARTADEVYVCGTLGVLRKTTDGGVTWTNQRDNLPGEFRHLTRNIVLTIPGTMAPEKECLVMAHYDSYNRDQRSTIAPGANDNGSGSSAVLEAARILSGCTFGKTVKLALFSGEELGLLGSNAYVDRVVNEGRSIVCAVNADMIGRPVTTDTTSLTVSSYSVRIPFLDSAVTYNGRYGIGLTLTTSVDATGRSDHVPFTVAGFNAITLGGGADPYYHTAEDTWEKVRPDLIRRAAQLMVATVADLAEPVVGPAVVDTQAVVPAMFSLKPNYPNPFNPSTTIEFDLVQSQRVTVEIFDILGCQVDVVLARDCEAGTHRVRWDASDRAAGVYFVHVQAGARNETRPMILLR